MIRGHYYSPGSLSGSVTPVRAYCHECGSPYPWTKDQLDAAHELIADLEELSEEEREELKSTIDELSKEGPKTEMAARRWKKLLPKVAETGGKALERIATKLISEGVKQILQLP